MSGTGQLAIALIGIGILLWVVGHCRQLMASKQGVSSVDDTPFDKQLNALVASYPDLLPAVPGSSFEYDGWFQEVVKRAQLRSASRTHAEGLVLLKQVSECHEQWLKIAQTRKAILREAGKDARHQELEELEHQAKRMKLQLQIAETQVKLAEVKDPRRLYESKLEDKKTRRGIDIRDEIFEAFELHMHKDVELRKVKNEWIERIGRSQFGDSEKADLIRLVEERFAAQSKPATERERLNIYGKDGA